MMKIFRWTVIAIIVGMFNLAAWAFGLAIYNTTDWTFDQRMASLLTWAALSVGAIALDYFFSPIEIDEEHERYY